jgi:hypothetical protein
MTDAVMTLTNIAGSLGVRAQVTSDTNGLGHSRDVWRDLTAAKLSKRQQQVLDAMRALKAAGTARVHYLDVWHHMTASGVQIMPQTVCSRIGELITAGRLREVIGVTDTDGRKGRIVELVAQQTSIQGVGL